MIKARLKGSALLLSVSFLGLFCGSQQADAQAATSPLVEGPAPSPPTGGLEDIIVTARKREESIQNTPLSVTALTSSQLRQNDLTSLEKVAATTPQLNITRASTGSGASISLRGVGAGFTSVGVDQSVAVIVDGTYYGEGRVINEALFDLARLEILKGPQALFFGKNATAGVISLTSADPGDKLELRGTLGYEIRSHTGVVEAIGSTPITDHLGVRLAVRVTKSGGGYFKNETGPRTYTSLDTATGTFGSFAVPDAPKNAPNNASERFGRLTLKWEPTTNLTTTLKVSGTSNRGGPVGYNTVPICAGRLLGQDAFTGSTTPCGRKFTIYQNPLPAEFGASGYRGAGDGHLYNRYDSYAVNNVTTLALTDATITSVTNYNNSRTHYIGDYSLEGGANTWAIDDIRQHAFSNETRLLTSFDGPINLLLGGYYQKTKKTFFQDTTFGFPAGGVILDLSNSAAQPGFVFTTISKDSATKGETAAGYGQVTWAIVPKLELAAGVRYTHETKDSTLIQNYVQPLFAAGYIAGVPLNVKQRFNNWSPDVTLTWRPSTDLTLYGAYKTGFKSGGFSNGTLYVTSDPAGTNAYFKAERVKGFEGGVKAILLNNQLRTSLGIYRYTYRGLQVDYFNPSLITYVTTNVGASRVQGVEMEFQFAPRAISGLRLNGSANYNKSVYRSFIAPCFVGQTMAQGCTLIDPQGSAQPFQDLSGHSTADAPRLTASLGFDYNIHVAGDYIVGFSGNARYSDKYTASAFGIPLARQHSYAELDAGVRFGPEDERWQLAILAKNLTNHEYFTGAFEINYTGSGTGTAVGRPADLAGSSALPRTVQARVSVKF